MRMEKAEEIYNNHINGNIRDFREQVKKLSKKALLEFIYYLLEDAQVKLPLIKIRGLPSDETL